VVPAWKRTRSIADDRAADHEGNDRGRPLSSLLCLTAIHVEWNLFHAPVSRLLQFVRRKKLHWCVTDPRSGKSQSKRLPTWLSDDGDLGNFTAMQKKENRDHSPNRRCAPNPSKFSRMTSKRGFDPMLILRARSSCSAPNSDRFKMPLMRNTQMSSG
jgi:hypothetical protein